MTSRMSVAVAVFLPAMCCLDGIAGGVEKEHADTKAPAYVHPTVVVPYASRKPTIDGLVDDSEWSGALSHRALRTTGGLIGVRQTRFWVMWDEQNLYVAMRSPLRKGERPIQQHREPYADTEQIFDDSYEIWVSAGQMDSLTGQLDCSTKFLSNVAGAHFDTLYMPNVGNERVSSYETGWRPKNRITDQNEWEMELAIPRQSLGTTKGPFHDGQRIRMLLARNYKRPWEQCSFEGLGGFSVTDKHSLLILSKTAPALHLENIGDAAKGTLGLALSAQGQSDMPIRWHYRSPDVSQQGTATVAKGKLAEVVNNIAMDKTGDGQMRITVTGAAGGVLLDWASQRAFGFTRRSVEDESGKSTFVMVNHANDVLDDKADVIKLETSYNPVRSYLKVRGDFIDYDNRTAIESVEVTVKDAKGREVGKSTCQLDTYAYAKDMIRFEEKLPDGDYTVLSRCLDKSGKAVETREVTFNVSDLAKQYDWFNTRRGNIETVVKPWTPVTLKGKTFGVWGREMILGSAGLPAQITTQGKRLFAEPGRLVATGADGNEFEATGATTKTLFNKDFRKTVRVKSRLGDIDVQSDVQVEFDGLYKVTMTLNPKKATTLNKLRVILPLDEEMADYIHACAALIRAGFYYGPMPKGQGKIWDCISLGDGTMVKGSFIPYVWIGSPAGGLAWFADSDEGWVPSDETPALEIFRHQDGQVELVLNIVSETFTLDKPRTLTFGLQASPAKMMHDRWRENNWGCDDTFKNYAHDRSLIWESTPFPLASYLAESKKMVEAQHQRGKPAVPYFIHTVLPKHLVPELNAFFDEWTTNEGEYGSKALCYRGTLNDYMVHKWGEWARDCQIDGYYVDNMRPIPCDKIEHGCGYRLPDGRVQPAYGMFGTREYFLRSRAAILEERPKSLLVLHMTNAMILPWVGAADLMYDGEHNSIYPEMGKDFMDMWALDRIRAAVPHAWGTAPIFMQQMAGRWNPIDRHRAGQAYVGMVGLHDILTTDGYGSDMLFQKMRRAFGVGDADVRFLGYWEDGTGIASANGDIKLAGWLKSDKMLLMVVNFGEEQVATVTIDSAKLGWGRTDLEVSSEADFGIQEGDRGFLRGADADKYVAVELAENTLRVPVARHNFRLLVVHKKEK